MLKLKSKDSSRWASQLVVSVQQALSFQGAHWTWREKQQAVVKKLGLRALGRGCQKGHLEHLCRVGTLVFVSKAPKNRRHLTTDLLRFVYLP